LISQAVVNAPQNHTISGFVKKGTTGSGWIKVSYIDSQGRDVAQDWWYESGTAYDFERFEMHIDSSANQMTVEVYGSLGSNMIVTGLMLNVGDTALQWQHSSGEIYNTNVLLDMNGVRVMNSAYDGYTAITPQEFAGYARVDGEMTRVFSLNGDTTIMKKARMEDEMAMAPIKIVTVTSPSYTGWAFIADE